MPTIETERTPRPQPYPRATGPFRRETSEARAHTLEIDHTFDSRFGGHRNCTVCAEVSGPRDAPVVVALGGISARAHIASNVLSAAPGWWEAQVGPQRALDTQRLRVLSIDWLGSDGSFDAPIDTTDQAGAVFAVCDALGVSQIPLVVGASYGAMVALQMAARSAKRVGAVLAWSGTHRPHPFASAWRSIQRKIVHLRGVDPTEAVSLARQLAMLSYRSPKEVGERFTEAPAIVGDHVRVAADDYLEARGAAYAATFSATAFARLSESIDLHFIDPSTLRVPLRLVAIEGDLLAPPDEALALARACEGPVETTILSSRWGHDAFLKEEAVAEAILRDALAWAGIGERGAP